MPSTKLNEHTYCLNPRKINISTCAFLDTNSAYNGPHAEPTNIGQSYKSNDKYKKGTNNVKILTEHACCTSAKEPIHHFSITIILQTNKLILLHSTLRIK